MNGNQRTPKSILESVEPPTFIIGVHRSGTSLLTRLIEQLGIFVGKDLQSDHESLTVIALNNLYFKNTDSSWDKPSYLSRQSEPAQNVIKEVFLRQTTTFFTQFGVASGPWAFKDPRFVVTLPLWRELFPQSKVVVIRRSPVDIALSLFRRHQALTKAGIFPTTRDPFQKGNMKFTQRCATFEGALEFAIEQTDALTELIDSGLCESRIEISYAGLCNDPAFEIWNLCRFLEIKPTSDQMMAALSLPRTNPTQLKNQKIYLNQLITHSSKVTMTEK